MVDHHSTTIICIIILSHHVQQLSTIKKQVLLLLLMLNPAFHTFIPSFIPLFLYSFVSILPLTSYTVRTLLQQSESLQINVHIPDAVRQIIIHHLHLLAEDVH